MKQTKIILRLALASAKFFSQFAAVCAEVFCRHSFGIRYTNQLILSFVIFCIYAAIARLLNGGTSLLMCAFLVIYFVLLCYHLISMSGRQSSHVHSYSAGSPWPFLKSFELGSIKQDLFIEPLSILIPGMILYEHDPALGAWLDVAAVSLFVKRAISKWNNWHHILDVLDTRVEGERLNEAVRERSAPRARSTSGHAPVSAGQAAEPEQFVTAQSLDGHFDNLDPGLRGLLEDANDYNADPVPYESPEPEFYEPPTPTVGPLDHLPRITSSRR